MKIFLLVSFCLFGYSVPEVLEDGREIVEPEHLSNLLKEKNYDEFNRLVAIDKPSLTVPRAENDGSDPRYNRDLEYGDFLMSPAQKESFQGRNVINPIKHPSYRWKGARIIYAVDGEGFTAEQISLIHKCIQKANEMYNGCLTITWYYSLPEEEKKNVKNYVYIINGNGCWSYMGCQGGQQAMSLQSNGCLHCGTIAHEFLHAAGFMHEHSRADRDNHITMRWENINPGWEDQFNLASYDTFVLYSCYDVCSIMHYPRYHRDLCKAGTNAFDLKVPENDNCSYVIGYATALTDLDKQKLCKAYPKK